MSMWQYNCLLKSDIREEIDLNKKWVVYKCLGEVVQFVTDNILKTNFYYISSNTLTFCRRKQSRSRGAYDVAFPNGLTLSI